MLENGHQAYLCRAVDHEGEVLDSYISKRRDRKSAFIIIGAKTEPRF